jgi:hypothetical protein
MSALTHFDNPGLRLPIRGATWDAAQQTGARNEFFSDARLGRVELQFHRKSRTARRSVGRPAG